MHFSSQCDVSPCFQSEGTASFAQHRQKGALPGLRTAHLPQEQPVLPKEVACSELYKVIFTHSTQLKDNPAVTGYHGNQRGNKGLNIKI